jgi:ferredoxin-thioredoxin reductase catalytic chain
MIYRCKVCGYIYRDDEAPHECPLCHKRDIFEVIDEKKINYDFFIETWTKQVNWMNATKYQNEIKLNPNKDSLRGIAKAEGNSLKSGKQAYCPCRILSGNLEADRKIICPCCFYIGEVEMQGRCHCSLYVTPKWITENKK